MVREEDLYPTYARLDEIEAIGATKEDLGDLKNSFVSTDHLNSVMENSSARNRETAQVLEQEISKTDVDIIRVKDVIGSLTKELQLLNNQIKTNTMRSIIDLRFLNPVHHRKLI